MLPPYLSAERLNRILQQALEEDLGPGDVTSLATVDASRKAEARFLAKQNGVLAGLYVAEQVLACVDSALHVSWTCRDGEAVSAGTVFGTVEGAARSILAAERLALNVMQRMSGIATLTRRMVDAARPHRARILDTRKTAPGLRPLDKWAVLLGGGENHRIGLYDMILIKDNHITAAGGVTSAIRAAQAYVQTTSQPLQIEVEARTPEEVAEVLAAGGVDYILLDNMVSVDKGKIDTSALQEAVSRVDGRIKTEASGNVTLETVPAIAATGVDYISCGALTHSVQAMDISLKITL
jgi:nicotinate-nucleotide pyrophosphorylase (carboxylating)